MIIPKEIMELPEKERNKVFRKIKAIMKKRGLEATRKITLEKMGNRRKLPLFKLL